MNKQNISQDFEHESSYQNNNKISCELAEFIGWHIGDGCISITKRYSEYTLTGDITEEHQFYKEIIVPTFNNLFKNILNKEIKLKQYKSNKVCGIYIFNKDFVKYLQEKLGLQSGKKINVNTPEVIQTKDQKICFLRGLFDTDGSIYYCKSNVKTKKQSLYKIFHYKAKIKLATISKNLIDQVYTMLCDLGFSPRIRKPARQRENENIMYGVVLYRKNDINKWIEEIGFKNPKHLTKIQLWKKYGFCPPYTKLDQRYKMLNETLSPLTFYPEYSHLNLNNIKDDLNN